MGHVAPSQHAGCVEAEMSATRPGKYIKASAKIPTTAMSLRTMADIYRD